MREGEWPQVNPTNTTRTTAAATNTHSIEALYWRRDSPIPYLFGGLALVLGLIVTALLILSCSHRRHCSSSTHVIQEMPVNPANTDLGGTKAGVVVVMAGDDKPTYLATPVVV
ncbi:hypothetical protein Ancab_006498 [Ancistrocladus abbreviatus]